MSLGKRLKEARIKKGMTQEEASKYLGITFQALSNYERDIRDPDTDLLRKMAELYNVSSDFLLGVDSNIETIAAHHDGEDWTEEELEDIENFKEFVRMKRKRK